MDKISCYIRKKDVGEWNMKKLLVGSLLTLAMLAGISFGSALVDQNQAVTNHNDVVQLASDLPFEY